MCELKDTISIEDVTDYCGIDYLDDVVERNIKRCISTADAFLKGSIGSEYPRSDPRSKEVALAVISELYDGRGTVETLSGNTRRMVHDLSWQLRLELRRGYDE